MYFPCKIIILFSLICWLINGVCWWITVHSRSESTAGIEGVIYLHPHLTLRLNSVGVCVYFCTCAIFDAHTLACLACQVYKNKARGQNQLIPTAVFPWSSTDGLCINSFIRSLNLPHASPSPTSHNHIVSAPSQPPPVGHTTMQCSEH